MNRRAGAGDEEWAMGEQGDLLAGRGEGGDGGRRRPSPRDETPLPGEAPESGSGPDEEDASSGRERSDLPERPFSGETPGGADRRGASPYGRRDRNGGAERTADRLARARTLVERGRVQEAVELYRTVVSENPTDLKARHNLGVLYDELGRHDLAVEQLEAARDLDGDNVEVLTNLGSALAAAGRFDESERELRRAQRLEPDRVDVRAALGVLFFRRGLYAQAEAELRWVCERDDAHLLAHIYRGEALNRLGRVEQAIDVLERVVQLQPDNAKAYYTLGILFDRKHMKDEAARMYRKSREVSAS